MNADRFVVLRQNDDLPCPTLGDGLHAWATHEALIGDWAGTWLEVSSPRGGLPTSESTRVTDLPMSPPLAGHVLRRIESLFALAAAAGRPITGLTARHLLRVRVACLEFLARTGAPAEDDVVSDGLTFDCAPDTPEVG